MELKIWELIDFLKELYPDKPESEKEAEIHVLDLNLDGFWDFLSKKWGFLDKSALDIDHVAEDYKNRKNKWNTILEDAKNLTDLEFVLKHGDNYLSSMHETGELDEKTIKFEKDHVLKSPHPIALEIDERFLDWNGQKIYSFKIYEASPIASLLQVNLHIKHEKRLFHEILFFFSISIERGFFSSMESINNFYHSMIVSYEITKFLESANYQRASAWVDDYSAHEIKNRDDVYFSMDFSKSKPLLFKVFFIDMISNSIKTLLLSLSSQLEKIQAIFDKFKYINQPSSYYSIYEEEVKQFIEQGKRLFLKSEDLIYTSRVKDKKSTVKQEKKQPLTEEKLLELFQLDYDHDIKENIVKMDAGFRSLPNIFEKSEKRLQMSWKTFNDKALNIIEKSPRFEKRKRMKTGGGKEFRIKPTESITINEKKIPTLHYENLKGEKIGILMDFEQAKILHDDGKIKDAVGIFERILESYQDQLDTYSYVYCDTCYRLGLIYENNGYFDDAKRVYNVGKENLALSNQKSYSFEIALFKIELLRGNHQDLLTKLSEVEKKINKLMIHNFAELNSKYKYIEGTNIEDLDIVYIRDLKRDPEYSKNPVFQEVVQLDLDLLNLNVLKIDLLRRLYYAESLKNMEIEIDEQSDEIFFKHSISEKMKDLLERVKIIQINVNKNNFNWGNKNFILFRLFKEYFTKKYSGYVDSDFDIGIPNTFFPFYYTKFLFNIAKYTLLGERDIHEQLNKFEFISLDPESQVEYLIKFCVSNWRGYSFGTHGYARINIYKNMKTLIDHANYLVEKFELVQFNKIVKTVQSWMAKMVEEFIEDYSKTAERLKKREVMKK